MLTIFVLIVSMVSATCPVHESNQDSKAINITNYGGLWYEYVHTASFSASNPRECGTWNLLAHNVTAEAQVFDVLHHYMNKTKDAGKTFKKQALICGANGTEKAQSCQFFTDDEKVT